MKNQKLTAEEAQAIKVLNYIATFDGIIQDVQNMKFLLNEGIKKFIAPNRQWLIRFNETDYPIKIDY